MGSVLKLVEESKNIRVITRSGAKMNELVENLYDVADEEVIF